MNPSLRRFAICHSAFLFAILALVPAASADEWFHWRGPEQTGGSREKNLPDKSDNSPIQLLKKSSTATKGDVISTPAHMLHC